MNLIQADHQPSRPWRNGGGSMRDLLVWPQSAQDTGGFDDPWRLRISLADIDRSGPFSAFPGVSRWFAITSGAGVTLELQRGATRVAPGDAPLQFDGAEAPGCRLIGGATRALNLMFTEGDGELVAHGHGRAWFADAEQCGMYTTRAGTLAGVDATMLRVPSNTLVWMNQSPGTPLEFHFDANVGTRFDATGLAWWIRYSPGSPAPQGVRP